MISPFTFPISGEEKSLAVNFIEFSFMVMEFPVPSSLKTHNKFQARFFSFIYRRSEREAKKYQEKLQFMGDLHSIKLASGKNGTQEELWNLLYPALTHKH
jgi:hypothetical protein